MYSINTFYINFEWKNEKILYNNNKRNKQKRI